MKFKRQRIPSILRTKLKYFPPAVGESETNVLRINKIIPITATKEEYFLKFLPRRR